MSTENEILTIDDLADFLRVKKSYIYMLTSQKSIPHLKLGRHLRFIKKDIEVWLQELAENPERKKVEIVIKKG